VDPRVGVDLVANSAYVGRPAIRPFFNPKLGILTSAHHRPSNKSPVFRLVHTKQGFQVIFNT